MRLRMAIRYALSAAIILLSHYCSLTAALADSPCDGGDGDGWGAAAVASFKWLGGPLIAFSSNPEQIFSVGDAATQISAVTIYQNSSSAISASNDIRIRIPAALAMCWDVFDTEADISGSAAAKVSARVSYPDEKTLLIDVSSDFVSGNTITVSGLSFADFTAASTGRLGLDIYNSGAGRYWDSYDKVITAAFTFGDGWAYLSSGSRCLTAPVIISPAQGDIWVVNSIHPVKWSTSGFSGTTLRLQYSKDGFVNDINNIPGASALAVTGGSFDWAVPDDIYDGVKVRLLDNDNPDVGDDSSEFKITGAFDITSPDGGENLSAGTVHDITWTTIGTISAIKLEYSGDNFVSDIHCIGEPPILNEGTYPWNVPFLFSGTLKVRVSSTSDDTVCDTSGGYFAVISVKALSPNGGERWEKGYTHNIVWDYRGLVRDDIALKYSTNGGAAWKTIDSGQTKKGSYPWEVPDDVSSGVKLKVYSVSAESSVYDVSDADFAIEDTPAFNVTSPDGGEEWKVGKAYDITWEKTGRLCPEVDLYYSIDGGNNWAEIASGQENSGAYSWVVPDAVGARVKVKVVEAGVPEERDTAHKVEAASGGNFSIIEPSITVLSPNGGELWVYKDAREITWTSAGTISGNLLLEYSVDGGNWTAISSGEADDGAYNWSVPDVTSGNVKVRITDGSRSWVQDESDAYFSLSSRPHLTVIQPNGGESLTVDSPYSVKWAIDGQISSHFVKIQYSKDNFAADAHTVSAYTPNDGEFTWLSVPQDVSSTVKIRVTDYAAEFADVTDVSDNYFAITLPYVKLISPNGGESWYRGGAYAITWEKEGALGNFTLEYSIDNGADWKIIVSGVSPESGSYVWIPGETGEKCLVRIRDPLEAATNDVCDASFSILAPCLTVISPNGGESWVAGTPHEITWASYGAISPAGLELEYSSDGGTGWTVISSGEANDGAYNWSVAGAVSGTCKVRLTDTGQADKPRDVSDGVFAILAPQLTVVKPNGGELWTVGDSETVSWTVEGKLSGDLLLEYSKDNFTSDIHQVTTLNNASTSYDWKIPNDTSCKVRVRITDTLRPASTDKSNADFTILPIPEITLTAPNGGESWIIGTRREITWEDNGGPVSNNLKLEYTADGSSWMTIASGEANDGSYTWTMPDDLSGTARVRITDASRPSTTDISNSYFSIALPTLGLLSPNGGEFWAVGDIAPVKWASEGSVSNNLVFYFSGDSGASWTQVASNESNDGTYSWTVPDEPSPSARVKVIDGSRPAVNDISDEDFTIISEPEITLTAPDGGETYVLGDTVNITWASKGLSIGLLKIEYSADNFATSRTIAGDVSNTGSYSWTIPDNALSGSNIKLRISGQDRPEISDTSNAAFRIRGGFTINSPKGGERWGAKSPQTITWTTKGTIGNVKLEYSLDSGSSWNTIISSVANTNSYSWILPDAQKNTCRVRVSDAGDSTVNAISAQDFGIVYYTIAWNILDYDSYSDLRSLNVNCSSGWTVSDASLVSPVKREYPYGDYTTFWSRTEYIERSIDWTADSDKFVTLYLESSISAQIEWHVLLSTTYTAGTDTLKSNCWLERRGKMVGLTAEERGDLKQAALEVYDGDNMVNRMVSTAPNSQGVFVFSWADTGLESGKTYFVKAQIRYRDSAYTSGGNIDVTAAKAQSAQTTQLQSLQTSLSAGLTDIKTTTAAQAERIQERIGEVKADTSDILSAVEKTIPEAIKESGEDILTEITDKVEPQVNSYILNTESAVKTGDPLTVKYRTYSGLNPVIDVYNAEKEQKIGKGGMKEIGSTGVYEYAVTFFQSWGEGDFTIICSEPINGVMDAVTITVIKTSLEQIYNQISAVLGTTSGITDLKQATDALNSQFSLIETALGRIGKDSLIAGKDAGGSASALESVYSKLSYMAGQIEQFSKETGINLEKLYNVSEDKGNNILYLKNKTLELKAAVDLSRRMVDNIANKPITRMWYEYKE